MKHKRQIMWSLIMTLIVMIVSAVIAVIDPLNTKLLLWNWTGFAFGGLLGVAISVWVAVSELPNEKAYFSGLMTYLLMTALISGVLLVRASIGAPEAFIYIVWPSYFIMLVMCIINGFVAYLAYETPLEQQMKQFTSTAR